MNHLKIALLQIAPLGRLEANLSNALDSVAYLPELSGSKDTCVLKAGGNEKNLDS